MTAKIDPRYDHVWFWRTRLPHRKGQPCRVVVRGGMNSILVEFPDGERYCTSRYAVRRINDPRSLSPTSAARP